MAVTRETVRDVAALARLSLEEAEIVEMTSQLNSILEHMEALTAVDTAAVTPAIGPAGRVPLRNDRAGAVPLALSPADLAPAFADGFFTIPRLASHDSPGSAPEPGPDDAGAGPG